MYNHFAMRKIALFSILPMLSFVFSAYGQVTYGSSTNPPPQNTYNTPNTQIQYYSPPQPTQTYYPPPVQPYYPPVAQPYYSNYPMYQYSPFPDSAQFDSTYERNKRPPQ